MNTMEDEARSAMRAIASTIDDAPPLRLPRHADAPAGRPRWQLWIAPLAAAVAVVAVAATLVAVRGTQGARPAPVNTPARSSLVPEYYVALVAVGRDRNPTRAVVRDTFTGALVTSVSAPSGWVWSMVAGAADDRTFVLFAARITENPSDHTPAALYELRLSGGAHVTAALRRLPVPVGAGLPGGLALAPDGTKVAVGQLPSVGGPATVDLRVYSVATGAELHAWSGSAAGFNGELSWTAAGLAFGYYDGARVHERLEVRMLQVTRPGNDLYADSRLVWSIEPKSYGPPAEKSPFGCGQFGAYEVLVTADGKSVVCGASGVFRSPVLRAGVLCPAIPPWNDEGVLEYSTATGKLARTLYRSSSNCIPRADPADILWTSASGDAVIGYYAFGEPPYTKSSVIRFGVFTAHKFTPLPVLPTTDAFSIAF